MHLSSPTNTDPDLVHQDEVQYASIVHQGDPRGAERSPEQTADSGAAEGVQYACVQYRRDPRRKTDSPAHVSCSGAADDAYYATVQLGLNKMTKQTQEDDDQYTNVKPQSH